MAASVDLSVEVLQECMVKEISLDGNETYVLPLTMSENLTKLANKIDFSKDDFDENKSTSEVKDEDEDEEDETENKSIVPTQATNWPWESVRNKLRSALTELSVLNDVLLISKERRLMILDFVSFDHNEPKAGLLLVARKRALSTSASFLNNGLDRIKKNIDLLLKNKHFDFHYELLKLKKSWRIKKVGSNILGDLSYKSAGSRYWQNGTFEILKTDSDSVVTTNTHNNNNNFNINNNYNINMNNNLTNTSNLNVIIPGELCGTSSVQVFLLHVDDSESNLEEFFEKCKLSSSSSSSSSFFSSLSIFPSSSTWVKRLEASQNVIFCKEVFTQLTQEAVRLQSTVPHLSCGNRLLCHLFPDVKLLVSYQFVPDTKPVKKTSQKSKEPIYIKEENNNKNNNNNYNNNDVLEHSLYQLLRQTHNKNANQSYSHPTSWPLPLFKTQHLIGPKAYNRLQLSKTNTNLLQETMLEQFIRQAKYFVLRQKILEVIDKVSEEVAEPKIIPHVVYLNSTSSTSIKVSMFFTGFELIKTNFAIFLSNDEIKVATKDATLLRLNPNSEDFILFIYRQIVEHQVFSTQMLAKMFGWKIISQTKIINNYKNNNNYSKYNNNNNNNNFNNNNNYNNENNNITTNNNDNNDNLMNSNQEDNFDDENNYYDYNNYNYNKKNNKINLYNVWVTIASPYHDKTISIKCENSKYQKVTINFKPPSISLTPPSSSSSSSSSLPPKSSISSQRTLESVNFKKLLGRNFPQKLETLIAALMPDLTQL